MPLRRLPGVWRDGEAGETGDSLLVVPNAGVDPGAPSAERGERDVSEHDLSGEYGVTGPAGELVDLLSDISEDCYCAGWLLDCEHEIWEMVAAPGPAADYRWGMAQVTAVALERLRVLSAACGGWVRWRDRDRERTGGPVFVPLAEWTERHARWVASLPPRPAPREGREG